MSEAIGEFQTLSLKERLAVSRAEMVSGVASADFAAMRGRLSDIVLKIGKSEEAMVIEKSLKMVVRHLEVRRIGEELASSASPWQEIVEQNRPENMPKFGLVSNIMRVKREVNKLAAGFGEDYQSEAGVQLEKAAAEKYGQIIREHEGKWSKGELAKAAQKVMEEVKKVDFESKQNGELDAEKIEDKVQKLSLRERWSTSFQELRGYFVKPERQRAVAMGAIGLVAGIVGAREVLFGKSVKSVEAKQMTPLQESARNVVGLSEDYRLPELGISSHPAGPNLLAVEASAGVAVVEKQGLVDFINGGDGKSILEQQLNKPYSDGFASINAYKEGIGLGMSKEDIKNIMTQSEMLGKSDSELINNDKLAVICNVDKLGSCILKAVDGFMKADGLTGNNEARKSAFNGIINELGIVPDKPMQNPEELGDFSVQESWVDANGNEKFRWVHYASNVERHGDGVSQNTDNQRDSNQQVLLVVRRGEDNKSLRSAVMNLANSPDRINSATDIIMGLVDDIEELRMTLKMGEESRTGAGGERWHPMGDDGVTERQPGEFVLPPATLIPVEINPPKPEQPGEILGNPGNAKNVGRAGEAPPKGKGKGFNSPAEGGPGTRGKSDGSGGGKKHN